MCKDINLIVLAELNKIKINEKTFELKKALGGNGASSFMYTNIINENEKVFVKFLISPRNAIELCKFQMESNLIESVHNLPVKVVPKLLKKGNHKSLPIEYYVTEWIDGKSLKKIISDLANPSLDEIISIVHRCASSMAYIGSSISHRDLHPGNIIFLDQNPYWANNGNGWSTTVDAKVIITDFGNAIMPLAFSYEDTGYGNEMIYQNVNRRIEGSFRSLPPEVFSDPMHAFTYNASCGESWAIGILFYKLLTNENILDVQSISEYANLVCTNKLEDIIAIKLSTTHTLLENNYILIRIIEGLLKVKSLQRMPLHLAAKLLWNYRFGDLNSESKEFQKKYIDAGGDYPPMRPDEYDCY